MKSSIEQAGFIKMKSKDVNDNWIYNYYKL